MNLLATTCGLVGHVNSVLGILEEALRRGHTVSWAPIGLSSVQGVDDRVRQSGVEVVDLDAGVPMPDGEDPFTAPFLLEHFVQGHDDYVERLEDAMRRRRSDVALYDMSNVWTVLAAHRRGIPYAGVPQGWPLLATDRTEGADHDAARELAGPRDDLFRRFGVPPHAFVQQMCVSPTLNLLATTPPMLGEVAAALPPSYEITGPTLPRPEKAPALPRDFPTGEPVVYLCFGTLVIADEAVHRPIVEACAALGVTCVVSSRRPDVARLASIGSTRVYAHVPQVEVLKRAAVAVFHGGVNSLSETILCGVPTLVVPFFYDQFDAAICVERAGIGRQLQRAELSASRVAEVLAALLDPAAPERRRVAELQRSYEAADGSARSVDALERLAAGGSPIR